jgi:hypothetical protein
MGNSMGSFVRLPERFARLIAMLWQRERRMNLADCPESRQDSRHLSRRNEQKSGVEQEAEGNWGAAVGYR